MIFEDDDAESLSSTLMLISRSTGSRILRNQRRRTASQLTLAMNLNQVENNRNDDGKREQTRHDDCRSL